MRAGALSVGLSLVFAAFSFQAALPANSGVDPFLYARANVYSPLAWMHGGDRFSQGATIFIQDQTGRHPLVNDFAASADPVVSFDAARVLFAGKKSLRDNWQVWEFTFADGSSRRITYCADDCVRPLYLPDDRFVYAKKVEGRFVIEAAPLSGGAPLSLTYGPGNFMPSDVLRDGRILFGAAYPSGNGAVPEIYTVYSDGSGMESYRCDHGPRHAGRQMASGDIVFARARGLARFTSALAHEVEIPAPRAEYAGDVAETSSQSWLVTVRKHPKKHFSIAIWKPGERRLELLVDGAQADVVQPTLLQSRPVPNRHPSALHDWTYANLLCLNAYTSKYSFPKDSIATVRVYTQAPTGSERLLGISTVERDGSFYLQTPADQPLKIELLDAAGKALKRESGWFWLRRGEQRVCVGCHAGPETAPENTVPAVLLRSTVPTDLTGSAAPATGGH